MARSNENIPVRFGVGVIVCDGSGRILLEKRADNGCWGLPGGRVESGESVTRAAWREVLEETGLSVQITGLLGVYSEPEGRIVTFADNGDTVHKIDVILTGRIEGGTLSKSRESESLEFFDRSQLPQNVTLPARQPLEDFVAGRVGVIG